MCGIAVLSCCLFLALVASTYLEITEIGYDTPRRWYRQRLASKQWSFPLLFGVLVEEEVILAS